MKICSICKELKDYNLFYKNKSNKDGHHSSCKDCQSKNKKYDREKRRQYYLLNKERDREKNSDRRKKYYLNNLFVVK